MKTATLCLCKNNDDTYTIVRIYTFGKDGYFVIDVPWTEIMAEKKYTNKINVRQMNQEEIEFFKSKLGNNTGTLYVFKNTKNINDVIQEYIIGFKNIRLDKQIGFIFGRFNIDMRYNGIPIKKYDYFGGKDSDYIIKEQIHISVLLNNKNNSIEYYIKKDDTYYDASNNVKCTKEMKHIGDMYLDLACRNMRNNKAGTNKIEISKANILKDNDNKDNKNNNDKGYSKISDYDLEYNDFISNYEFLTEPYSLTSLVRNGQHINGISIHGLKHSSTRGGDKDALKKCGIRSELSYSTFSNQSGFMDKELGIQGNKNQHSGKLPEKLTSLIKNSRYDAYNKLKKILETNIEQPSIEQPSIEQPSIEQPSIEQTSNEETSNEQPIIEETSNEQPSIEQPSIEQPSNEETSNEETNIKQGPYVQKYQKLPLSEKQLNEIIEKISENKNKACNDPHLLSYYNKNCL